MADTIGPLEETTSSNNLETEKLDKASADQDNRQGIFDDVFQTLMNGFGQTCEEQGIETAIAIAKHPEKDEPIVFYRGHIIDAAALAAGVLRQIKKQVFDKLNTEPNR